MGLKNAEIATEYTLKEKRPDFVLSIGFGGALYKGAEIGELVWPSRVLLVDGDVKETLELSGSEETARKISRKLNFHEGSVLTFASRMKKSGISASLFRDLPFPVCDMETFATAKTVFNSGLPFLAVRSISDRADEEIPSELFDTVDDSGNYRLSRALAVLFRNPGLIPCSIRLGMNSRKASQNLWLAVRSLTEILC
jgi:adenosylhomocysteine nucleosidase